MSNPRASFYFGLAILSVVAYAFNPTLAKQVLGEQSPLLLTFLTTATSGIVLALYFGVGTELKRILKLGKRGLIFLVVALLSSVVAPLATFAGLQTSPVLNMVLFMSLQAPITATLSALFLKERINYQYVVGVGLMLVGILLYVTEFGRTALSFSLADGYFLLAATSFAISDVVYKKYLSHTSPELVLVARNVTGSLLIGIFLSIFASEHLINISLSGRSWLFIGLIALFPIIIGQLLWYKGLKHLRGAQVGVVSGLYPVLSALIAFGVLREPVSLAQLGGALVIMVGLVITNLHFKHHRVHAGHLFAHHGRHF